MNLLFSNVHLHRGLFIIDRKGILRQITMNDLPVSELRNSHTYIQERGVLTSGVEKYAGNGVLFDVSSHLSRRPLGLYITEYPCNCCLYILCLVIQGWALCGWDAASGTGFPVYWRTWRGWVVHVYVWCGIIMIVIARSVPCWLETWWIDGKCFTLH